MSSHVPDSEHSPPPAPSRRTRVTRALGRGARVLSRFVVAALAAVLGRWTPPAWPRRGLDLAVLHRKRLARGALAAAVLGLVSLGVQGYLRSLPQPARAHVALRAPQPPAEPDVSGVQVAPDPLLLQFDRSVAPLDAIGKAPVGVTLDPFIAGTFTWRTDREIAFVPAQPWPVGTAFEVELPKKGLVAPHVLLDEREHTFTTAPLTATLSHAEFHEDPRDPRVHKVVATVSFNYPVDTASVSERARIELRGTDEAKARPLRYDLELSAGKYRAFLHSENVPIPLRPTTADIIVDAGVRALLPGAPLALSVSSPVAVPGQFSFFRVQGGQLSFVDNEKHEPERVLFLSFTAAVDEGAVDSGVEAYALPRDRPAEAGVEAHAHHAWDSAEVSSAVLRQSKRLALTRAPTDDPTQKLHGFRFDARENTTVYVRVKQGLKSVGGFVLAEDFAFVDRAAPPPKTVELMTRGALLSLQGERKVPLISRSVEVIDARVARFRADALHHLLSQTSGRFEDPRFQTHLFNENNIADIIHTEIPAAGPGDSTNKYTTLDLGPLVDSGERGLFLVIVREKPRDGIDDRSTTESYGSAYREYGEYGEYGDSDGSDEVDCDGCGDSERIRYRGGRTSDRRLLLVTDLGLLWKRNNDGSGDVFVQSIRDGTPVAGARVSILSLNGSTVLERATDSSGHAVLPALGRLAPERRPIAVVVEKGRDLSFLPWDRADRRVDTSRFDTGGATTVASGGLEATLFSDRGLYRPGEAIRVAGVAKHGGFTGATTGVPLEIVFSNPAGAEVSRARVKLAADGLFEHAFSTRETSPTGSYTASLYTVKDEHRFSEIASTPIRVEEFEPDRMKIRAALSDARLEGWVSPERLSAAVRLETLFGTAAEGRNVEAHIELRPASPHFSRYADYTFSDTARARQSYAESLGERTTDKEGAALFDLALDRFAAGTYQLVFTAEGHDVGGGRAVVARASAYVSPLAYVVGTKADGPLNLVPKGAVRKLDVIAVNSKVERMPLPGLTLKLIEERYVSVLVRREDGTYAYQSKQRATERERRALSIGASGTKLDLPTNEAGDFVAVIEDASGNELHRVAYSVSGTTRLAGNLEKNAELDVRLDKTDYSVGEPIRVRVLAPYVGAGLITIERDRVVAHKWFRTTTNAFEESIALPAGVEGNAYVHVSFLRDTNAPEVFTSPLSTGVAAFSIDKSARTLKTSITSDARIQPGDSVSVTVKTDQPSRVVVWGVDEGILQLARYQAPDPLGYFMRKRALQVDTSQILDLVMPEYSVLRAAAGGDAEAALGKNLNPFKRKTDKPAVFWSGIVDVDASGKTLKFPIPETFDGTLKIMAVAVREAALGAAQTSTLVRGHFVVQPSAPLFLAPGDEAVVTVGVTNLVEGSGKALATEIASTADGSVSVLEGASAKLSIDEGREQVHKLRIKAGSAPGRASVKVIVSGKGKRTERQIELSIRPASPYLVDVKAGWVKGGSVDVTVPRRLHAQLRTLEASVSALPIGMAAGLARYLETYPYGCTEQMVSRAIPALVAKARPELLKSGGPSVDMMAHGMEVLAARQNSEGAFGLWADTGDAPPFVTLYATHVLLDAKERGLAVPAALLQKALAHIEKASRIDAPVLWPARLRAYALYLAARSGRARGPDVQKLVDELRTDPTQAWKKDLTGLYLAAAWKVAKDDVRAAEVLSGSQLFDVASVDPVNFYDQSVRDAQYLYVLAKHFPEAVRYVNPHDVARLVDEIAVRNLNSLTAGYALLALDAYGTAVESAGKSAITVTEVKGGAPAALSLSGSRLLRTSFDDASEKLVVTAGGDAAGFYSVVEGGFDVTPPTDRVTQGLEIVRELVGADGKAVTSVAVGDVVEVHVSLRSLNGENARIAIVDLLPAGFLVQMDKAVTEGSHDRLAVSGTTFSAASVDVREDRVVLYGAPSADVRKYVYRMRAVTPGRFVLPPAFAEGMYDRNIRARSPAATIEVR